MYIIRDAIACCHIYKVPMIGTFKIGSPILAHNFKMYNHSQQALLLR